MIKECPLLILHGLNMHKDADWILLKMPKMVVLFVKLTKFDVRCFQNKKFVI